MASATRGSGPWPPLRLQLVVQLAALIGTLAPQVRSGADAESPRPGPGRGGLGRGGTTGGASPSPGSGSPQVGLWPVKTS